MRLKQFKRVIMVEFDNFIMEEQERKIGRMNTHMVSFCFESLIPHHKFFWSQLSRLKIVHRIVNQPNLLPLIDNEDWAFRLDIASTYAWPLTVIVTINFLTRILLPLATNQRSQYIKDHQILSGANNLKPTSAHIRRKRNSCHWVWEIWRADLFLLLWRLVG